MYDNTEINESELPAAEILAILLALLKNTTIYNITTVYIGAMKLLYPKYATENILTSDISYALAVLNFIIASTNVPPDVLRCIGTVNSGNEEYSDAEIELSDKCVEKLAHLLETKMSIFFNKR